MLRILEQLLSMTEPCLLDQRGVFAVTIDGGMPGSIKQEEITARK